MKIPRRALVVSCLSLATLTGFLLFILVLVWIGRPASYVWVMDAGALKNETYLTKMCPTGERLVSIQFGQSAEIDVDPGSHIVWAPEFGDVDQIHFDEVVQLNQEGRIVDRFQGYSSPILAVDGSDGSIWVSTWHTLEQRSFMTKIAANGKFIRSVAGFYLPASVALDPRDRSIWVADSANHNITHLSKDGDTLFQMSVPGYFFTYAPDQVAIEPQTGNVWFTTAVGTIYKLSPEGKMLFQRDGLSKPIAVTINPHNGTVWVADFDLGGTGALLKLDSEGRILLTQALPGHPYTAAVNPFDGVLWVGIDGEMIRYDEAGNITGRETGFHEPDSIAFAPGENNFPIELKCIFYFYTHR